MALVNEQGWQFETAVRTLWQEVRGEVLLGQKAVAHVIVNRRASGRWGHTWASVVLWPMQFSGWNDNDGNRKLVALLPDDDGLLEHLRHVLAEAENEDDFTNGATHYYAPLAMSLDANGKHKVPNWVQGATACGQWGRQLFYKNIR